jgi:two-component system CheB/CheR fusion protein
VNHVLDDLRVVETEVRLENDGWFLTRIAPYRTADDHIAGVVVTFVDITRRKNSEDDLREAHERLLLAIESADAGWGTFDVFQERAEWNGRGREMLGLVREAESRALLGWLNNMERADRAEVEKQFLRAIKTKTQFKFQFHVNRGDGSACTLHAIGRFTEPDGSGEVRGTCMLLDVTDREEWAEELRTRNEELERFNDVAVGRELQMIKLKKEINALLEREGEAPRYRVEFKESSPSETKK